MRKRDTQMKQKESTQGEKKNEYWKDSFKNTRKKEERKKKEEKSVTNRTRNKN